MDMLWLHLSISCSFSFIQRNIFLRKTEREKTFQLVIVMSDKSLHVSAGRRDVPQLRPGEEQGQVQEGRPLGGLLQAGRGIFFTELHFIRIKKETSLFFHPSDFTEE